MEKFLKVNDNKFKKSFADFMNGNSHAGEISGGGYDYKDARVDGKILETDPYDYDFSNKSLETQDSVTLFSDNENEYSSSESEFYDISYDDFYQNGKSDSDNYDTTYDDFYLDSKDYDYNTDYDEYEYTTDYNEIDEIETSTFSKDVIDYTDEIDNIDPNIRIREFEDLFNSYADDNTINTSYKEENQAPSQFSVKATKCDNKYDLIEKLMSFGMDYATATNAGTFCYLGGHSHIGIFNAEDIDSVKQHLDEINVEYEIEPIYNEWDEQAEYPPEEDYSNLLNTENITPQQAATKLADCLEDMGIICNCDWLDIGLVKTTSDVALTTIRRVIDSNFPTYFNEYGQRPACYLTPQGISVQF